MAFVAPGAGCRLLGPVAPDGRGPYRVKVHIEVLALPAHALVNRDTFPSTTAYFLTFRRLFLRVFYWALPR